MENLILLFEVRVRLIKVAGLGGLQRLLEALDEAKAQNAGVTCPKSLWVAIAETGPPPVSSLPQPQSHPEKKLLQINICPWSRPL